MEIPRKYQVMAVAVDATVLLSFIALLCALDVQYSLMKLPKD